MWVRHCEAILSKSLGHSFCFVLTLCETRSIILCMKTSSILKQVKKLLWDGTKSNDGHEYICWAIEDYSQFSEKTPETKNKVEELPAFIERTLGIYGTVESWLEENSKEFLKFKGQCIRNDRFDEYNIAVQAYRRAWVDHLIKEFKAKGD